MDLNTLELFVAVAETSSVSAAAKRLSLPKSTVSRGLARLERSLGVTLVNRTTRRVSLSTAGAALYENVAPRLAALQKALGELPEADEAPSGLLTVTAAVDFGVTVLPELVAQFCTRYPQVSVEVNVTNRLVDLVAERIDVAFRASPDRLKDSALMARRASSFTMQLFAAPSYLARRGTPRTPADLAGHDWVVFRSRKKLRLEGPGETVTLEVQGRLGADDLFFLLGAARAGAGLAALPTFLVDRELAAGTLQRVLPRWSSSAGTLWVLTPGGQRAPRKTVAFRDFALDYLRGRTTVPN